MNQYNPNVDVSANDRLRQRSNEAENARLAASAGYRPRSASEAFDRVKHFVDDFKSRAASGRKRLRPL